jgi:hypothetical protein
MGSYAENIGSEKSKRILNKGASFWLGNYANCNGARWVATYKDKWYYIVHDGTGNQFFCSHEPQEISETEAKEYILKNLGENKFKEIFQSEGEEIDELLGL